MPWELTILFGGKDRSGSPDVFGQVFAETDEGGGVACAEVGRRMNSRYASRRETVARFDC
jgi:hypothetical protein